MDTSLLTNVLMVVHIITITLVRIKDIPLPITTLIILPHPVTIIVVTAERVIMTIIVSTIMTVDMGMHHSHVHSHLNDDSLGGKVAVWMVDDICWS